MRIVLGVRSVNDISGKATAVTPQILDVLIHHAGKLSSDPLAKGDTLVFELCDERKKTAGEFVVSWDNFIGNDGLSSSILLGGTITISHLAP